MPRRALTWVAVTLLALLLVGAGGWLWLWERGRHAQAISEGRALADFRHARAGTDDLRMLPGEPAPGVYTYAQRGHESGGIGPLGIDRELPGEARYTITAGTDGFSEKLALAAEHIEAVRFRLTPAGARIAVWRRTDITFAGVGRDDRRDLTPPVLDLPAHPSVGLTWTAHYAAGNLDVHSTSAVLRRETIPVAGVPEPTLVIRSVGDTRGAHNSTRVDRVWWSPRLKIPVRWTIDMRVRGIVRLDTRTDLRLVSTRPMT
ncbi:MAG TPA: hypothetical protein PKE32_07860 [Miltoncostaeaceae bacterium]|nr:hypothetical protein [Miltoncostaeaceae bacterium]